MHLCKQDPQKWNFYSPYALLIPILKLRQPVLKFVFFIAMSNEIDLTQNTFFETIFVLKRSLIFHRIFLPKVPLAAVLKNLGICEYCSNLKAKKA